MRITKKQLSKIILEEIEKVVNEEYHPPSSLSSDEFMLLIPNYTESDSDVVRLVLATKPKEKVDSHSNFFKNNVKAVILMHKSDASGLKNGVHEIKRSAAIEDYGPSIYDLALMFAEKGVMSDRQRVSNAATNVWNKYLNDRPDVSKFKIKRTPTSSLDYYYTIKEKSDVERLRQSGIDFMEWNLDNRGKDIESWISQYLTDLFRIKY